MSALASHMVCAGCGAALPADEPLPFRCPAARAGDDVDHVLAHELDLSHTHFPPHTGDDQPFVRFRELLHTYRLARRAGASDGDWIDGVHALDQRVAQVDGRGFFETPYVPAEHLANALGLGSLWIKNETGAVGGSHKARHLFGVALHLARLALPEPPRLAIASCGNAALAAAIVARAAQWPLDTFVPSDADPQVLARLAALDARIVKCARSATGPAGDPCMHAYRAALEEGALPFSCQGSENGLVIEGGATLGLEIASQHAHSGAPPLNAVFVQVGGGAMGSALAQALRESQALGALASLPRFFTVQTIGAHPLARAWRRLVGDLVEVARADGLDAPDPTAEESILAGWLHQHRAETSVSQRLDRAGRHRARYMWPWEHEPRSLATGILDDETYDWLVLARTMIETGGWPVVVSENQIERALRQGRAATGIPVSATGSAGLAGIVALHESGALKESDHVMTVFSGVER